MLAAPYPADTRAKGWRFEIDLERVIQSDTWALATPEVRPWLLMLWTVAWQQVPCGSMPSDDALIAARLGMKPTAFKKAKDVLMRGWWLAEDGRLYHDTITERVLAMLGLKETERKRKAEYRARMEAERKALESSGVPQLSHGTDEGRTEESGGSDATGTRTGTRTGLLKNIGSIVASGKPSRELSDDFVPKNEADWQRYFRDSHGVTLNERSQHDRAKAWPLFAAWSNAKVTVGQMRQAIEKAQADATEPIAFLPAYVDRVLASMQAAKAAPPKTPPVRSLDDNQLNALGEKLGIGMARAGESRDQFIGRILTKQAELAERNDGEAA